MYYLYEDSELTIKISNKKIDTFNIKFNSLKELRCYLRNVLRLNNIEINYLIKSIDN